MDNPITQDAIASTEMSCKQTLSNEATAKTTTNLDSLVNYAGELKNVDTNNNKIRKVVFEENIAPNQTEKMNSEAYPEEECSGSCSSSSGAPSLSDALTLQSKPKELLMSFSRSGDGSICTPHRSNNSTQLNSKFKIVDVFDCLSSMGEIGYKAFSLPSFVVAGIASNLKSLGVEEIDCKEHVEAWLSQRRQRRWKQSLGRSALNMFAKDGNDSFSCFQTFISGRRSSVTEVSSSVNEDKSETFTYFSPSQPNSSLLRLTGDGNVKLGQFLQKMEEVRNHLNNATCTFLQASCVLTLPYLKLLSGNQLQEPCYRTFSKEWMQVVASMTQDLRVEASKEVDIMLSREYQSLRNESKALYKGLEKLHKKISKVLEEHERDGKPALQRLQPKCLPKFRGRRQAEAADASKSKDSNANKVNTAVEPQPDPCVKTLQLSPVPLNRANLTTVELFKNHIFFSKSKKGFLIFKTEIEGEWRRFSDLPFNGRRELLLHVFDDLHWTLKLGTSISAHVKELFIEGYPESVTINIRENLKYLKKVSKDEDLLMLSKVTIANQVRSFNESLSRLVLSLENARDIAKSFSDSIKLSLKTVKQSSKLLWRKRTTSSTGSTSLARDNTNWDFDVNMALRFDNAKIKLLVPYQNSMNPFVDQFSMSFVE